MLLYNELTEHSIIERVNYICIFNRYDSDDHPVFIIMQTTLLRKDYVARYYNQFSTQKDKEEIHW